MAPKHGRSTFFAWCTYLSSFLFSRTLQKARTKSSATGLRRLSFLSESWINQYCASRFHFASLRALLRRTHDHKTSYAPTWDIFNPREKLNQAHSGLYFMHNAQYKVCDSCDNRIISRFCWWMIVSYGEQSGPGMTLELLCRRWILH